MTSFGPRVALVAVTATLLGNGVRGVRAAVTDEVGGHMLMTTLRVKQPGDQARADAIAGAARRFAERYVDYRRALRDGYVIFMPDQKQTVYHFVLESADDAARTRFDADKPAALLYDKVAGGYKLVGVMYTDRFGASEEELNARVPLSIAQWHEHLNMCVPPDAGRRDWLTGDARFGLGGSITTETACREAGGRFVPHLSGWMTHVYPLEKDPARVWRAGMDDDDGVMAGMKR